MGQEIPTNKFCEDDFDRFSKKLKQETELLQQFFQENRFCNQHHIGGFEIEAWLVNNNAMPSPCNEQFLDLLANPLVVMELAKFNIELNVTPRELKSTALRQFHGDLETTWKHCLQTAQSMDCDLMTIGIHPGINENQLTVENMSASPRYKALNEQILMQRRGRPLLLNIQGRDQIETSHEDVMLESATTSFQIHLQVRPHKAGRAMNASMIASAPLLAVSANSPFLFGYDLWDETRIPLFEQSVDDGTTQCKRVSFGVDYVKQSLLDCFNENLEIFPPLLPIDMETDAEKFSHLRLHNGTIWRWNRPLVGFSDNKLVHLRIENRVVPAGPTLVDMLANAAFFWGLVRSLTDQKTIPEQQLPFVVARKNFYSVARNSLSSYIQWLDGKTYPVRSLISEQLIESASHGLLNLGIDSDDCDYYLNIIRERTSSGQNGAVWQRRWKQHNGSDMQALSIAYLENQKTGKPVHEWPV